MMINERTILFLTFGKCYKRHNIQFKALLVQHSFYLRFKTLNVSAPAYTSESAALA